jgi:hypothetical protein
MGRRLSGRVNRNEGFQCCLSSFENSGELFTLAPLRLQ